MYTWKNSQHKRELGTKKTTVLGRQAIPFIVIIGVRLFVVIIMKVILTLLLILCVELVLGMLFACGGCSREGGMDKG